jgi:hypothetical protein
LPAQAMSLYTYDLDSLVYMSPQIVEGTLGGQHRTNNFTCWEIRISGVHKGALKVQQSIDITALDFFRVSSNGFWNNDPLKEGAHLFLFLDRAKSTFLYDVPANAEIYWPAPSGVRLVAGEKVLAFSQYNNPGPYLAVLNGAGTNAAVPTVPEFRDQIHKSMSCVEKWRAVLEGKPTTNDIPLFLEILQEEKSNHGFGGPGSITDKVCKHLVELHDVTALTNALALNPGLAGALDSGFDTRAGRRFLWSQIEGQGHSVEERTKWAGLLAHAGEGAAEEHHLRRIAKLACSPGQDEKLQAALLNGLRELENWRRFTQADKSPDSTTRRGMDEAELVLRAYAHDTDFQEVRHRIDLVLAQFSGQKGIVSILKVGSYDAAARRLNYHYDFVVWEGTNVTTQIAFQHPRTRQTWLAPADLGPFAAHTAAGGIKDVIVPKDLPKGHYRVFCEFFQDGVYVAASRYFEADL